MKALIHITALAFLMFGLLSYAIGVCAALNFNPIQWAEWIRFVTSGATIGFTFVVFANEWMTQRG